MSSQVALRDCSREAGGSQVRLNKVGSSKGLLLSKENQIRG